MDNRIQGALDGELAADGLTPSEAAALTAAEAGIRRVLDAIPTAPLPDLAPAVLRRIELAEASRNVSGARSRSTVRAALGWIWTPRPVSLRLRPVYGLAAAFALALFVMFGRAMAPAPPAPQQVLTHFLLSAPDAHQVSLAGDFTGWQPQYALSRTDAGVWTVVVPLEPGVHSYAFVVDGERWVPDPNAPAVDDGFGGLNSRLAVLAPDDAEP